MQSLNLFHGTLGEFPGNGASGAEVELFPLTHFGSFEAAIHRLAFLYADSEEGMIGDVISPEGLKIDGKSPAIYEVEFVIDEQRVLEMSDWGDPGALGTLNKIRERLQSDGAHLDMANAVGAMHKSLWDELPCINRNDRKVKEYEFRKMAGEGLSKLGIDVIRYKNNFEGSGDSYCFSCAPKNAVLIKVHNVPVEELLSAVLVMRPKLPKRYQFK